MKLHKLAKIAVEDELTYITAKEGQKLLDLIEDYVAITELNDTLRKENAHLNTLKDIYEKELAQLTTPLKPPKPGDILKCFACALDGEWGTWDSVTGAVICKRCRDARAIIKPCCTGA